MCHCSHTVRKQTGTQLQRNVKAQWFRSVQRSRDNVLTVLYGVQVMLSWSSLFSGWIDRPKTENQMKTTRAEAGQRQKKQGKLTAACLTSIQKLVFVFSSSSCSLHTYLILQTVGGRHTREKVKTAGGHNAYKS